MSTPFCAPLADQRSDEALDGRAINGISWLIPFGLQIDAVQSKSVLTDNAIHTAISTASQLLSCVCA